MLGNISWNLPSTLSYTSYSFLFPSITVSNPTNVDRQYQIVFRVTADDWVIAEYSPYPWFTVPAGGYTTLSPVIWLDRNGVRLSCVLLEKDSSTEVTSLSVDLTSGAAEMLQQMVQPITAVMMLGMVMSMVGGIITT
jgi:hypothetical protein